MFCDYVQTHGRQIFTLKGVRNEDQSNQVGETTTIPKYLLVLS